MFFAGHANAHVVLAADYVTTEDGTGLADVLSTKTANEWQEWARERDIPLAAVVTP